MPAPKVAQPNQKSDYDVQYTLPRRKYLGQKSAWCHSPTHHGYSAVPHFVQVPCSDEYRLQKPQDPPLRLYRLSSEFE